MSEFRRSSRLKVKAQQVSYNEEEDDEYLAEQSISVSQHKPKRAKVTKRASGVDEDYAVTATNDKASGSSNTIPSTRRKKGKLANLPEMPLDVLYEVRIRRH